MTALEGMRVLDMTQYEAGTSCTQALAWLGADVVKIESPERGDPGRGPHGNSEYFILWNSNKRSIAIDLKSESGRQLFLDLVPKFDVFVENYGPGVVERLQIDYETLRTIKPDIIYGRIKGFGLTGPWSDYKCYDMVAQAVAGAFSITGEPEGPPMRPGPTMGDAGSGVQMALAICAAYIQKLNTGKGQLIELSMQEAMTYYLRTSMSGGQFGDRPARRSGNGQWAGSTLYRCLGDDQNDFVWIMAVTPKMFRTLCKTINRMDLIEDEHFRENRHLVKAEVEKWTVQRDKYEAMRILAEAGVPAGAVLSTKELHENTHLSSRGFVHEIEHPEIGKIKLLGMAARLSESEVPIRVAPMLGEHTEEVLNEELDIDGIELEELRTTGVI
ncbi:MAG: CoA transferase [Gammaproteobacteria bacterium]|nr:CoA transferase [Gammaproteobacteria bacterium]